MKATVPRIIGARFDTRKSGIEASSLFRDRFPPDIGSSSLSNLSVEIRDRLRVDCAGSKGNEAWGIRSFATNQANASVLVPRRTGV